MEDIKFFKPDKKKTCNGPLIRKAFKEGFKQGLDFMMDQHATYPTQWRKKAFKEFCKQNKIKL